MPAFVLVGAP